MLNIDSDLLALEIADFIVPLYVKPTRSTKEYISDYKNNYNDFLKKCQSYIVDYCSGDNPLEWQSNRETCTKLKRVLMCVERLIKQTDIYGLIGPSSVSCMNKGEQIT